MERSLPSALAQVSQPELQVALWLPPMALYNSVIFPPALFECLQKYPLVKSKKSLSIALDYIFA